MARIPPKPETLRRLFALSGNRCAFPGCCSDLINEKGIFIGQVCHIEAANTKGQRYNENQTEEERRSFDNLVIFCYPHHKETDNVVEFTTDVLKEIKKNHESRYKDNLFEINNEVWNVVYEDVQNALKSIYEVTLETNEKVKEIHETLKGLVELKINSFSVNQDEFYISQLDSIKDLKKQNKQQTALELLLKFKESNWDNLNDEIRYKVIANIGLINLDLYSITQGATWLLELEKIPYEKGEIYPLLALASAILNDKKRFKRYYKKGLEKSPKSTILWIAFINISISDTPISTVINTIPEEILEMCDILFAIGDNLIKQGNETEGMLYLRRALAKVEDTDFKADVKAVIATHILMAIIDPFKVIHDYFTDEERSLLNEAEGLLTDAWENVKETELVKSKYYIVLNRGVIRKVQGRLNEALLDFSKAYELSHDFKAFENLLLLHIQLNQFDLAEHLINIFPYDEGSEEQRNAVDSFKVKLLHSQGKTEEAIFLLESIPDTKQYEAIDKYAVIITMLIERRLYKRASDYINRLKEHYPTSINGPLLAGLNCSRLNDYENARLEYLLAYNMQTGNEKIHELSELGFGLNQVREYDKGSKIFEKIADRTCYNILSRDLIYSWYQSGNLEDSLYLASKLFENNKKETFLVEILMNIYLEVKKYDEGIEIGKKYIQNLENENPDDFVLFKLVNLYFLKRDIDNVKKYSELLSNPLKLPIEQVFSLAFILIKAGDQPKGLELAYKARLQHYQNSEAHAKYLNVSVQSKESREALFPDCVKEDCAVYLKNSDGKEIFFLIVDSPLDTDRTLRFDDPFAKQLIGKRIGDEFEINMIHGFGEKFVVTSIIDKYVFAFRESLELFSNRFAGGKNNIGVLKATPGEPGDQLESFVVEMHKQKLTFQNQVFDLYRKGLAPIGVLAGLFKENVVNQWLSIINSTEVYFRSYLHSEKNVIDNAINDTTPIVIDISSLLSNFYFFSEQMMVKKLANELIISESTIDELQEFCDDFERFTDKGYESLAYENAQLVFYSIGPEDINKEKNRINKLINWCKENTKVITPKGLIGINRNVRLRDSTIIGNCFYDTILLAKEYSGVVLSDDGVFKIVLKNEHGISSFSTYQLAANLASTKKLMEEEFTEYSLKLLKANYVYIPPTADLLWKTFELSNYHLSKPAIVAIESLLVLKTEFCADQIVQYFKILYLNITVVFTREQVVLAVLNTIKRHLERDVILKIVVAKVKHEFRLLLPQRDELLRLIQNI